MRPTRAPTVDGEIGRKEGGRRVGEEEVEEGGWLAGGRAG